MFGRVGEWLSLFLSVVCSIFSGLASSLFPPKNKDITKDVILITGGGRGLGRNIALEFARYNPSHIILWGRNEVPLQETSEKIKSLGIKCSYMTCDVSKKENVYSRAEEVKETIGDVSILVNNAGIVYGSPILQSHDNEIIKTMQVNVLAHFWTLKAFLPAMVEKNRGHIVNISSVLGLMGLSGAGGYVSSKFCTTGLYEALSEELKDLDRNGIKLTSIHPYHIDNDMFQGLKTRLSKWLLPPVPEDYVAKQTVQAVLTNRCKILIPRIMYFLVWFKTVAPVGVNLALNKLTGTDRAMEGFKGHARFN